MARLIADFGLEISGVVHVGAHEGQEAETYARNGVPKVTWIEADPRVLPRLRETIAPWGHRAICALVSDRTGQEVDFYVTNNEVSSSMLPLGTHREEHPNVVVTESLRLTTTTLDDLCAKEAITDFNMLTIDVQGAELLVLRGASSILDGVDYLHLEVNERPLYDGCALLPDLDAHLEDFRRVWIVMTPHGWGDALYVRSNVWRRGRLRRRARSGLAKLRTVIRPRTRLLQALRRVRLTR